MSGVRQLVVSKRTAKTYRPELVLAPGPLILAQSGQGTIGDLYGSAWAFALYKDGGQLLQVEGGQWVERSDPEATAGLDGARHVSLAFDQAARPVLAWELGGQVYVRQFTPEGEWTTQGPFAGHDPVLISDALALISTDDSDVLLYHLDGSQLVARVQRERYTVAHVQASVAVAAVLDQAVAAGLHIGLYGEALGGEPLKWLSDVYPVRVRDGVDGAAELGGALLDLLLGVTTQDALDGGAELGGALLELLLKVEVQDLLDATAALAGSLVSLSPVIDVNDPLVGAVVLTGTLAAAAALRLYSDAMTGGATLGGIIE